jgi:hypothetical protein
MARQGGRVKLEQSDMYLALNMAKMAKDGFSRAAIKEMKYLITKPPAEVREEKKRGVEFPRHTNVKTAIPRHPAMLHQNQTSGCLYCQHGDAKNPQTCWSPKGTGAPPPARRRVRTPGPTAPPPSLPPAPTGNTSGSQPSEIVIMSAGYTSSLTAHRWAEFFEDDEDTKHNTDSDPDMLTEDG